MCTCVRVCAVVLVRVTTNAHHNPTLLKFVSFHHHEIRKDLPVLALKVLNGALLQTNTRVETIVNREGLSFMHAAVLRADATALRWCIDVGGHAVLHSVTRSSLKSPLFLACEEVIRHSQDGDSSIGLAVKLGELGERLAAAGGGARGDPLAQSQSIESGRDQSRIKLSRAVAILSILLDAKADVNHVDRAGDSPLHAAVRADVDGLVNCLILAGADVNVFFLFVCMFQTLVSGVKPTIDS